MALKVKGIIYDYMIDELSDHLKRVVFLYSENHALDAWFSKAYSGEDDKTLQIG